MPSLPLAACWFEGAVELEYLADGAIRPWRLPLALRELVDPALWNCAGSGAGVRIRVATDATEIGLEVIPTEVNRKFDLVEGTELLETFFLPANTGSVRFAARPAGQKILEIWLPQRQPAIPTRLWVNDGASVAHAPDPRRRWLTYGSSISHCGEAHSPARIWSAVAARQHNLHLTCLGFGGNCHLEPLVAMTIRDLPSDLMTFKLGINVMGGNSLSLRSFRGNTLGLIRLVRERQPRIPIGVISPIMSPPREVNKNAVGIILPDMRAALADCVARLQTLGDRRLWYFNGLELINETDQHLLPDQLHPNGDGYELMGQRAAAKFLSTLLAN